MKEQPKVIEKLEVEKEEEDFEEEPEPLELSFKTQQKQIIDDLNSITSNILQKHNFWNCLPETKIQEMKYEEDGDQYEDDFEEDIQPNIHRYQDETEDSQFDENPLEESQSQYLPPNLQEFSRLHTLAQSIIEEED